MANRDIELKPTDDLKWISVEENTFSDKLKSKGFFSVLVPVGCLVTSGILAMGIYQMYKKDSKKQQFLMRCRVLSQGITVALIIMGVFQYGKT